MDDLLSQAQQLAHQMPTPIAHPIEGRIAYVVSHGQSYASNGYAIRTQGIAKALNQRGLETLCFVRPGRPWNLQNQGSTIEPETRLDGVRYIHTRWLAGEAPHGEKATFNANVDRLLTLFRIYRPSAVLAASNWIIGLPAWVAAQQLGLPFYNEVRGFWELSKEAREPGYRKQLAFSREAERDTFVAQQAQCAFTLNEAMKAELVKRGVEENRIGILPNAVDALPELKPANQTLKSRIGIASNEKVIGYIGSFSAYEGLDVLLEACNELVQKGEKLKLLLVGDDQILTFKNESGTATANPAKSDKPWLIQVGRVPHEQVADYYALLDAVVIPRKPLDVCQLVPPMKAAEALAHGKRLIVSDVAPLAEYADKYEGVVSFEAGNAGSLATALQGSLKLTAPKPNAELLFSAHIEAMVKALKGERSVSGQKAAVEAQATPVDAKPNSPAVQLPFSDTLNVNFSLMSEEVKKKKTPWTHVNTAGVNKISIRAKSKPKIADKKIILRVRCFNRDGAEIEPVKGATYFSDVYKWFRYVTVFEQEGDGSQGSVDIPVSDAIASVSLSFVNLGDVNTDGFSASLKKEVKVISGEVEAKSRHENVFDYLHSTSAKKALQARSIIYGDVSPNVLDGSSIWLTSVTNIVSSTRPTLLLLKDNVNNTKVVSNIERRKGLTIVEPKDIGFDAPLDQQAAAEALSLLHAHCPQITALITRGVDLSYEIQKRKEFTGIFYPYLTDFYEVTEQGFSLVDAKVKKLKEIVFNARSVLFQTEEIHKKIEEVVGYKVDGAKLPPSIPDNMVQFSNEREKSRGDTIHIGYAGKVQPRWGVEELIEEVEKQISRGRSIKLYIATGKIHGRGKEGTAFVQRIRQLLKKDFVQLHDSLSREAAISLMAQMDLVWCYRDPQLENSTLELSTKLVETAALGKPCVVYGSEINKQFLGEDYPFFVNDPSEISQLIKNFESLADNSNDLLKGLASKVGNEFTFSSLKDSISTKLDEDNESFLTGRRIVISGHDLKFIYSYITHLRRHGAKVVIDPWEWGEHVSLRLSEHYSNWGDYIFCEWGLANAVWHSKNKKEKKKLFVRIHAQEVRKKAAKFGHAIEDEKVDKFIFVSPLIRKQALKMFGWNEQKANVIPNGVKENRFFNPSGDIKPVLGMVGIVPTTKRLDRALDLLASLNERGWKAKLYCKGHRPEDIPFMRAPGRRQELAYYEELYEKIANNPYLKGYVIFDGWGNDVEQWYQKVDFILSPSDNESFHYALADGVMAGCLPLIWPWEGAEETYSNAWIVSSNDDAVNRVEGLLRSEKLKVKEQQLLSKSFVFDNYFEKNVFEKLDYSSWG